MRPRAADPVKLVVSLFTAEAHLFKELLEKLEKKFGPVDLLSEPMEFGPTGYYTEEFGPDLKRKIASFGELIRLEDFPPVKLYTNGLEDEYLKDGKRRINIDPGYIALEKFVLASCKNFYHRIFLDKGVYAEVTLVYMDDDYRTLEWTYPDYKEENMKRLLKDMRRRYALKIGKGARGG